MLKAIHIEERTTLRTDSVDVCFCIVNWNTVDFTSQLIESIYRTVKNARTEIFVVDNASTDGSVQHIATHYPEVIIIQNDHNIGYGPAMNQALRISAGKYNLILNSDVILLDDALENMVAFLEKNQAAGAVGPICLDKEGNVANSYGYFPRPGLMILERIFGSATPGFIMPPPIEVKPDVNMCQEIEVEYIKGACMLVRKEVCDEIGLFDEGFFAYYEETDWCFRMMKRRIKRHLIPSAKIYHMHDASFSQTLDRGKKHFEDSKIKYLTKHYGKIVATLYICADAWANFRHKIKKALSS